MNFELLIEERRDFVISRRSISTLRGRNISVFLDWADFTLRNARLQRRGECSPSPAGRRRTRGRKVHSSAAPLSSAAGQRTRASRVQPHQRRRQHTDVAPAVYHARCAAPCRIENTVVGATDTRKRVSSPCISPVASTRVPQPKPRTCYDVVRLEKIANSTREVNN